MKFFISLFIFCMILFLLIFSFRYHTGEPVSTFDEAGDALTDTGVRAQEETSEQMQEEETVSESQEDGTTLLDEAVKAGKEEVKKWEEKSAVFFASFEKEDKGSTSQSTKDFQK